MNILTKMGSDAKEIIDVLVPGDIFGVTLTCHNWEDQKHWEPGAPSSITRQIALSYANSRGIETRVSFEPVIFPDQTLQLIAEVRPYTTLIQVGKLNTPRTAVLEVREREDAIDWRQFHADAVTLLESLGGEFYIKRDLAAYAAPGVV